MVRRRKSPLTKALHQMRPDRVLFRALSGPEVVKALRSKAATSTRTSSASRKKQVAAGKAVPTKKAAAKKATAKRDPYADALKIPTANRAAAAKQAKATQPGAAKKTVAVRKRNGQFDGRKAMRPDDLATYERAQGGYVDPASLPRSSRRRRTT